MENIQFLIFQKLKVIHLRLMLWCSISNCPFFFLQMPYWIIVVLLISSLVLSHCCGPNYFGNCITESVSGATVE